jgi:aminopeptidase N
MRRIPFILPGQPLRYTRDRTVKILHTKLEVELDFENRSVSGVVTYTVQPFSRAVSTLVVDAAAGMLFRSGTVSARDAPYTREGEKMTIALGSDLELGQSLQLRIDYSVTPVEGLYFSTPTGAYPYRKVHAFTEGWPENSHRWFPCFDYPNMRYPSETIVRAPKEMTVISNGLLVSTSGPDPAGLRSWHFRQELPHSPYLHSIVVGEFAKIEESDVVPLEYYVPPEKQGVAISAFSKTRGAMEFFSQVTGRGYPYVKYAQSAVDFAGGGTENVSATTLTDEVLQDERSHLDYNGDEIVVHELAHQWFGDYLTCKDWSNLWLNEGFATYFTALYKESSEGRDEFLYLMHQYLEVFLRETDRCTRSISTKRYFDPEEVSGPYVYQGAAWVLHTLRGLLGEEAFWNGIRHYVSRHADSNVETSDLRKALEDVSGKSLESFFEQWIYSPCPPEYIASCSWDGDQRMVELSLEQENAGDAPLFDVPIEIRLTLSDGTTTSKKIRMDQRRERFVFSVPERPLNVSVDPEHAILRRLRTHKPEEMLLHQLRADPNILERIAACAELSSSRSDGAVEALADCVDRDGFWGVKFEAAKAIGTTGTVKALEELLRRLHHPDQRVRRGVAHGLRGFGRLDPGESNRAVEALVEILKGDSSDLVRADAAASLGFYAQSEAAYVALRDALSQDSAVDMVRRSALLGLMDRGDARALPLAVESLHTGKTQGRIQAVTAIVKLGKADAEATRTVLALERDPDIRMRAEAATALAEVQDSSLVPPLESWLEAEVSGRVRRKLREALYVLKGGAGDPSGRDAATG